jgi:hypothetical protein
MRAAQHSARADRRLCGHGGGANRAHRRVQPADPRRWNLTRWNLRWGVSFRHHPAAGIHLSQPGLSPQLAARVLGEFGDARTGMSPPRAARTTSPPAPSPGAARQQRKPQRLLRQYFPKGTDLSTRTANSATSPPSSTTGHASDLAGALGQHRAGSGAITHVPRRLAVPFMPQVPGQLLVQRQLIRRSAVACGSTARSRVM